MPLVVARLARGCLECCDGLTALSGLGSGLSSVSSLCGEAPRPRGVAPGGGPMGSGYATRKFFTSDRTSANEAAMLPILFSRGESEGPDFAASRRRASMEGSAPATADASASSPEDWLCSQPVRLETAALDLARGNKAPSHGRASDAACRQCFTRSAISAAVLPSSSASPRSFAPSAEASQAALASRSALSVANSVSRAL
mmetsp:Transcript_120782/g.209694  ORF Transcript_120782/g.209694 Transcript_120782/m.209694 type:complete len:200 (+) Transcript_120782:474-1073(+)